MGATSPGPSMPADSLMANVHALVDSVVKAKPSGAKGKYVKKAAISSSMGPGLKLDVAEVASVVVVGADGSFSYTPSTDYTGPDSFSYRAGDGASFSAAVIVANLLADALYFVLDPRVQHA